MFFYSLNSKMDGKRLEIFEVRKMEKDEKKKTWKSMGKIIFLITALTQNYPSEPISH